VSHLLNTPAMPKSEPEEKAKRRTSDKPKRTRRASHQNHWMGSK
jgi:hypothetical protein